MRGKTLACACGVVRQNPYGVLPNQIPRFIGNFPGEWGTPGMTPAQDRYNHAVRSLLLVDVCIWDTDTSDTLRRKLLKLRADVYGEFLAAETEVLYCDVLAATTPGSGVLEL